MPNISLRWQRPEQNLKRAIILFWKDIYQVDRKTFPTECKCLYHLRCKCKYTSICYEFLHEQNKQWREETGTSFWRLDQTIGNGFQEIQSNCAPSFSLHMSVSVARLKYLQRLVNTLDWSAAQHTHTHTYKNNLNWVLWFPVQMWALCWLYDMDVVTGRQKSLF